MKRGAANKETGSGSRREGPDTPVVSLRNIGPVSAQWLEAIGIRTRGDLEKAGIVLAWCVLKDRFPGVSILMLYALHGALTGEGWNELSPETRARLKGEVEEALQDVEPLYRRPGR